MYKRPARAEEVVVDTERPQQVRDRAELVVEQKAEDQPDRDRRDEHRGQQHRPCEIPCPALLLKGQRDRQPDHQFQSDRHAHVHRGGAERVPELTVAERGDVVVGTDERGCAVLGELVVGDAEIERIAKGETDHPDEKCDEGSDHTVLKPHDGHRSFRGVVGSMGG